MGYIVNAAFAVEFDWPPMFGQLCGIMPFLGVVALVVGLPVLWACDFELPLAAANATPPPTSDATATASARMRLIFEIRPPFDADDMKTPEAKGRLRPYPVAIQLMEEATDLTGLLRRSRPAPTAGRRFLEPRVRVTELAPEALDQR